jgi:hypothetical protein
MTSVVKHMRTVRDARHRPTQYAEWLFANRHLSDLFASGIWPSFKEFTECAAGFHGVTLAIDKHARSNKNVVCYCIGDGHRPQMAAMVAALTAWSKIYSIDPLLCVSKWENCTSSKVNLCKMTTEEFKIPETSAELSIIIAIHSHADFNDFWKRIPGPTVGVCVPCCVPQTVSELAPCIEYIDMAISNSPMNAVQIWKKQ